MISRRLERVNELLLREISSYVLENQPPDTGLLTFTAVKTTDDLMSARVFYSVLGSDAEKTRAGEALNHMKFDLTRSMRRLESLKRIPVLEFVWDDTPARAARINELIHQVHTEEPPAPAPRKRPRAEGK
jgi:ribosome-binding factor A